VKRAQRGLTVGESVDDCRVELRARVSLDLADRVAPGTGGPVRAVARDRVERVGDGEDARAERDLASLEPVRVAAAVPALVMRAHDLDPRAVEDLDVGEKLLAEHSARLHHAAFTAPQ